MKDKKEKAGVSLMAGEIAEEIKNIDGFCTKKFRADFVTEGVDYAKLKEGDVLEIRFGARIGRYRITDVREVVRKENAAEMYVILEEDEDILRERS